MPACTFFGHRDCPDTIKPQLREVLNDLIANHGVTVFYVGHQGRFDAIVRGVLGQLQKENPRIFKGYATPDRNNSCIGITP